MNTKHVQHLPVNAWNYSNNICLCDKCRAAKAEYQRAYRAKRRASAAPRIDASTTQTYTMSTTPPVYAPTITVTSWPSVANITQPQSVTVDMRHPLERTCDALVAACFDLREAFAAYHQALTQEPAA